MGLNLALAESQKSCYGSITMEMKVNLDGALLNSKLKVYQSLTSLWKNSSPLCFFVFFTPLLQFFGFGAFVDAQLS